MDGSSQGFRVDEGAYEVYARNVDPLGDEVRGVGAAQVAPHVTLAGAGFSAMGTESGFADAYTARMRSLQERITALGDKWRQMGDASRQTRGNYDAVEADHNDRISRVLRGLE